MALYCKTCIIHNWKVCNLQLYVVRETAKKDKMRDARHNQLRRKQRFVPFCTSGRSWRRKHNNIDQLSASRRGETFGPNVGWRGGKEARVCKDKMTGSCLRFKCLTWIIWAWQQRSHVEFFTLNFYIEARATQLTHQNNINWIHYKMHTWHSFNMPRFVWHWSFLPRGNAWYVTNLTKQLVPFVKQWKRWCFQRQQAEFYLLSICSGQDVRRCENLRTTGTLIQYNTVIIANNKK